MMDEVRALAQRLANDLGASPHGVVNEDRYEGGLDALMPAIELLRSEGFGVRVPPQERLPSPCSGRWIGVS